MLNFKHRETSILNHEVKKVEKGCYQQAFSCLFDFFYFAVIFMGGDRQSMLTKERPSVADSGASAYFVDHFPFIIAGSLDTLTVPNIL
jgi:hypothetical protein